MSKKTKFIALKELFARLHGPNGCPWDKKQTHLTLLPFLLEEVGEFIEAVKRGDDKHMQEELGDILLQVMFHSQLASKSKRFDVEDVIETLRQKLTRRHPHVFGSVKVRSAKEVIRNWHRIKLEEKKGLRLLRRPIRK